tara:strand:+ start:1031 stop:1348 length:318 start_codon:yes stop_codon:yes gene_type:complete
MRAAGNVSPQNGQSGDTSSPAAAAFFFLLLARLDFPAPAFTGSSPSSCCFLDSFSSFSISTFFPEFTSAFIFSGCFAAGAATDFAVVFVFVVQFAFFDSDSFLAT